MNREQYIEKLLAIYKLRYKPNEVEIAEFKLLLEMMPDKPLLNIDWEKAKEIKTYGKPFIYPDATPAQPDWPPVVVMYGVGMPSKMQPYTTSTSTSTFVGEQKEKNK